MRCSYCEERIEKFRETKPVLLDGDWYQPMLNCNGHVVLVPSGNVERLDRRSTGA